MAQPSRQKKVRGSARVAFIAHLDTIASELRQGHTAQAVYERHQTKLASSISYQQFARYVRQLREDGLVKMPVGQASPSSPRAAAQSVSTPAASPTAPDPQLTSSAPSKGSAHARHEPATRRTFEYSPHVTAEEKARIIGPKRTKDT